MRWTMLAGVALVAGGTGGTGGRGGTGECRVVEGVRQLPADVRESSGLARGGRSAGLFWTHNDAGNAPVLYAVDTAGRLAGRVTVGGARLVDWEDIASGPCASGHCLYVGDIGDNSGKRQSVTVYVVPEPAAKAATASATALHFRYPDGPRDAEALFVLPSGDIYIVSKGRESAIALYRASKANQKPGGTATLERVRDLAPQPKNARDRVTAATASPDGRWVAIRTYRELHLYPADALTRSGKLSPVTSDLTRLGEKQGEAVALANDGTVWLSSEGSRKERAQLSRMACSLGGAPARAG